MDNNENLANVHKAEAYQLIIVWPLVWKHDPHKDWYLLSDLTTMETF